MSKIKKPIEIIRHPIEMHGKICSTARTKDDGATTVEWVRQTKQKDGYWTKSKITFTQLLIFELSHIPLTDADRWREGITSEDWVAKEIRKDKKPSFVGPDFNIFPLHVGDICGRYDFNINFNLIK